MNKPIRYKRESYDLYQKGLLGNTLRVWSNASDLLLDDYGGLIRLRYSGPEGANRFTEHKMSIPDGIIKAYQWSRAGLELERIVYCEPAVDERIILQGEIKLMHYDIALECSTKKTNMRDAMRQERKSFFGLAARQILHDYLYPACYEFVMEILHQYPEHTLEFTAFDCCYGWKQGWNTVFWELRLY